MLIDAGVRHMTETIFTDTTFMVHMRSEKDFDWRQTFEQFVAAAKRTQLEPGFFGDVIGSAFTSEHEPVCIDENQKNPVYMLEDRTVTVHHNDDGKGGPLVLIWGS